MNHKKPLYISYHAVQRFLEEFNEFYHVPHTELVLKIAKLIMQGIPIGAQLGEDVALEADVDESRKVYFVCRQCDDYNAVLTTLTREKLISNINQCGIREPEHTIKRRKFNRRNRRSTEAKLRETKPWLIDRHFRDTASHRIKH